MVVLVLLIQVVGAPNQDASARVWVAMMNDTNVVVVIKM